jgi:hypothetical protein
MLRKRKEKLYDVDGMAGALLVSQDPGPDDAQDMVGSVAMAVPWLELESELW